MIFRDEGKYYVNELSAGRKYCQAGSKKASALSANVHKFVHSAS